MLAHKLVFQCVVELFCPPKAQNAINAALNRSFLYLNYEANFQWPEVLHSDHGLHLHQGPRLFFSAAACQA